MFVRMSHWKCKKEFWTEAFKLFRSFILPMQKPLPCFDFGCLHVTILDRRFEASS